MARNEHYDAQPDKRRTRRFVIGLLVSLLVVAGLVFLAYRTLGAGGGGNLRVPDVTGQALHEAVRTLEAEGFTVKTVGEPSDAVPQNHVSRTDPEAGEKLDQGDLVTVFYASEVPVEMPKVIGMTLAEAKTALGNVGVDPSRIAEREVREDTCEPGRVTQSRPKPTEDLTSDTEVTLWVCAGAETQVPQIGAGTDVPTAEGILRDAGYSTSQNTEYSDQIEQGRVIGTDPSGGSYLAAGENVTIIVSAGPTPTTAPPTSAAPTSPPSTDAPATTSPPSSAPDTTAPPATDGGEP